MLSHLLRGLAQFQPGDSLAGMIVDQSSRDIHIAVVEAMRTNIKIDDKLMSDTLKATVLKTRKATVERCKLECSGDLDDIRRSS